jgi:glycosyltransferase involved in cell wall biosynthesis
VLSSRDRPFTSEPRERARPTLSVVVPVFNQESSIVQHLEVIRERISRQLGDSFEMVVVSDGSIDATEDALAAHEDDGGFRVFHYDRNLGKGYAVKLGALEADGEWIGFVDADLDLDPADLAAYVRHAQKHHLDFAIGSKRHPDSEVYYPRSRVAASWLFQQLVRLLFRLNVRDTQVGLKVFRREIAEQVLPLLLVKRYAFDIELLAVAHAFGFGRIEEMPIRLDYRFTGSGVRSRAVLRALIDTAAIFYRLRILRYYQRRRSIAGAYGFTRPRSHRPLVSVLVPPGSRFRERAYTNVEVVEIDALSPATLREAAANARGEVLAILEPHALAAGNWLSATTPFFARDEIVAVLSPKMAPLGGPLRRCAAAAVDESRIGVGLGFFRFTPGNVRYVTDFPASSLVVRRQSFLDLPSVDLDSVVAALVDHGGSVLYTPESVIVAEPPPLHIPHVRAVFGRGRVCGRRIRSGSFRSFRRVGPPILAAALVVTALVLGVWLGGAWTDVAAAFGLVYVAAVVIASAAAALRFQSLRVGFLAAVGIVETHVAYTAGVLHALAVD